MSDAQILKPLPKDLWGYHNETKKKKESVDGETGWYVRMLENVSAAAWWLVKDPTMEHLDNLKAALEKWDDQLGSTKKARK